MHSYQSLLGLSNINTQSVHADLVDINNLIINSTIKIKTGATAGYILTSDTVGNATWQDPTTSITLAGDVTGPIGSNTVALVGASSAMDVHQATLRSLAATASNTPSTIVMRDSGGDFAAGNVSANLFGNSTGTHTGDVIGNLTGIVTGSLNGNVVGNLTGNVTGDVLGNLTGQVFGSVTGSLTGNVTGDVTGNVIGNVTGNLTGNITVPTGSAPNRLLTSDMSGNATWQPPLPLSGDVIPDPFIFGLTSIATKVAYVGGSTASNVNSATLLANGATDANTANTIVKRDGSGNFSAGNITGNITGSAGSFTGSLVGDVTGSQGATVVSTINGNNANITATTSTTQTFTNKTITGTTNNIDANSIRNGSTWVIPFSGSAPSANNVLTYNGTNAVWSAPASASSVTMGGNVTGLSSACTVVSASGNFAVGLNATVTGSLGVTGTINTTDRYLNKGSEILSYSASGSHNMRLANAGSATMTGTQNYLAGVSTASTITTGSYNCAYGSNNMTSITTGELNCSYGQQSLFNVTTGTANTASGYASGLNLTTGMGNTFLGSGAKTTKADSSNSMALGWDATVATDNTIVMGNGSVTSLIPGADKTCDLGSSTRRWKAIYFAQNYSQTVVGSLDGFIGTGGGNLNIFWTRYNDTVTMSIPFYTASSAPNSAPISKWSGTIPTWAIPIGLDTSGATNNKYQYYPMFIRNNNITTCGHCYFFSQTLPVNLYFGTQNNANWNGITVIWPTQITYLATNI